MDNLIEINGNNNLHIEFFKNVSIPASGQLKLKYKKIFTTPPVISIIISNVDNQYDNTFMSSVGNFYVLLNNTADLWIDESNGIEVKVDVIAIGF